jgi:hypothetical protein
MSKIFSDPNKISINLYAKQLRQIYWTYAFHFLDDNDFSLRSREFVVQEGIFHLADVVFTGLNLNTTSAFICDFGYFYIPHDQGNDWKVNIDTVFQLPGNAFRYDVIMPASSSEEVEMVTIRKLHLEILSEMSNYQIYRIEMGKYSNFLPLLAKMLELLANTHDIRKTETCENSPVLFFVDRIINIFANLAFDAPFSVINFESSDCVKFKLEYSPRKKNHTFVTNYSLCLLAPILCQNFSAHRVGCYHLTNNILRTLCNCIGYCDDKSLIKLCLLNITGYIELMAKENREFIEIPVFRLLQQFKVSFHKFYIKHFYIRNEE